MNKAINQNLFNELRKLRNVIVHGTYGSDPAELAKQLSKMNLSIPATDLPDFISLLLKGFGRERGFYYVPQYILTVLTKLLDGRSTDVVCDPWAGIGNVLASVLQKKQVMNTLAFTMNRDDAVLGRVLLNSTDWRIGDPCQLLNTLPANLDVVASVLPFGMRGSEPLNVQAKDGTTLTFQGDLGQQILTISSLKLSSTGIGLFIIPRSFFILQQSVLRQFDRLGLGMAAAFALPSGTFAPYANVSTYLVVIEKRSFDQTFVAQLSTNVNTNLHIIENFQRGQDGESFESGRFVNISTFTGIESLRAIERLNQAERRFGYPGVRLGNLATAITLGRPGDEFTFPKQENAIFVPIIGVSDVIDSVDDVMILKQQNYAQIAIEPTQSDARFVARFLNSELGKEIRDLNKSGIIPKLNKQSLKEITVFVPDLQTQTDMLAMEARITTEENTLLGLQNEIAECRRELWANPHSQQELSQRLDTLSLRLSGELKKQTEESLAQWFESLPFPMASILRAWQVAISDDFKAKYEHLLHFFEASAEFAGIILLSAFSSREQFFEEIKTDLSKSLKKQNLSFKRATFGTWKLVVEYLGKKVRQMLSGDKDQIATCADMFADQSMQLPEVLSRTEFADIVSVTNKLRNDWAGHSGVVGPDEARLRNERLLGEVQRLRQLMGDLWSNIQLVHSLHCRPRRGSFENEVAILMGSNSEFLKETKTMNMWLDVEKLYLLRKTEGQTLQLLPLVQIGPSPLSAKNACYFFNRIEKDGLRYISYHFSDQPERKYPIKDVVEIEALLQENGEF